MTVIVGNHYLTEGQIQCLRPRVTFTLTHLWEVVREDGKRSRFASYDKWVTFQGKQYRPVGPNVSSIEQGEAGAETDFELMGFLSHESIQASDIHAGRYDNARIIHHVVDSKRPWIWVKKHQWWIKTITENGSVFQAEVQGSEKFFTIPVGRRYERECDKTLGGLDCLATPEEFFGVGVATVAAAGSPVMLSSDSQSGFSCDGVFVPTKPFTMGKVTWTSGPNKGTSQKIATQDGSDINLEAPAPYPIKTGDQFAIRSGCDGTALTCDEVYNNIENFGGVKRMPTTEDTYQRPSE